MQHPERIGPYRILRLLGEGGMGVVYEAQQSEPIERRAALKVIKHGMDTREIVARFETERQALAVMDHSGIARVYEAGTTEDSRPFFAMELVHGIPITEYSDNNRLPTEERIRLFLQLCHAIQHAHQKGVIHRDLKPSNVLVTEQDGKPIPKVIDFGIAKAIGRRLSDRTLVTEYGQAIGTPAYMSPEQAEMSGLDVDTRTDIYSLGVMLYELLVGCLPLDPSQVGIPRFIAQLVVQETEPPTPSERLSSLDESLDTVARLRRTDPSALKRQLHGDLDWIAMKALDHDRTRRYETANELATDLERFLEHEPVLARPPSFGYRFGRFVRRNRAGVALSSAFALTVVVFAVVMAIQAGRIAWERDRAEQEAETAQQVSDFLVGLFNVADPSEARGNTITAREIVDRGAEEIGRELQDQPQVQGRLMEVLGRVYGSLGLFADAAPLLEQAVEVRRDALGDQHPEVAQSLVSLAENELRSGRAGNALPLAEEALVILENARGPEDPATANVHRLLAWVFQWLGEFDESQSHLDQALTIHEQSLGPNHMETAVTLYRLGWQYRLVGDYELAKQHYERAIGIAEEDLGPDNPNLALYLADLGVVYSDLDNDSAAAAQYRRALSIREKALGDEHPLVAELLNNLGILEWNAGNWTEAQQYYERSLAIQENTFGPESPNVAHVLNNLGLLHQSKREYATALDYYERALEIRETALGPEHFDVASVLGNIGYLLRYVGDLDAALPVLERALAIGEKRLGSDHPDLSYSLVNLGILYGDLGDYDRALRYFQRKLEIDMNALGEEHSRVADAMRFVVKTFICMEDYAAADSLIQRALAISPDNEWLVLEAARLHHGRGATLQADSLFGRWLEMIESEQGRESASYAVNQARFHAIVGDYESALRYLQTALERGYSDPRIARNLEFEPLRGDPRFEAILVEVKQRAGITDLYR